LPAPPPWRIASGIAMVAGCLDGVQVMTMRVALIGLGMAVDKHARALKDLAGRVENFQLRTFAAKTGSGVARAPLPRELAHNHRFADGSHRSGLSHERMLMRMERSSLVKGVYCCRN